MNKKMTAAGAAIVLAAECMVVSCGGGASPSTNTPTAGGRWDSEPPLAETYADYFLIGNVISPGDLNSTRFDILKYHFNTLTAENHMKPESIAPASNPGSLTAAWNYRFDAADSIVNAARAAGMKMHGHTLVWHQQSPLWLAAGGDEYLTKFITDVMTHFKGRVFSWDVINEAFSDGGANPENWKSCLRDSPWKTSIGNDYIEKAFLAARAADPDALLYYNDYSINWNTNNNNANKAKAVYYMVNDINERYPDVGGRPLIDGIGMQSHHHINTPPASVEESLKQFSSLGVDITISEMDIVASDGGSISGYGAWGDTNSQKQAERYAAMFRYFKEYKDSISRVTFWGIDDGRSWRGPNHAMLFDSDYNLKPAFFAVQNPDSY